MVVLFFASCGRSLSFQSRGWIHTTTARQARIQHEYSSCETSHNVEVIVTITPDVLTVLKRCAWKRTSHQQILEVRDSLARALCGEAAVDISAREDSSSYS